VCWRVRIQVMSERISCGSYSGAVGRAGSTSTDRVTKGADRGLGIVLALVVGSLLVVTASADPATLRPTQGELAPDLAPASVTVTPSSPHEGDVLHVSVTIANGGLGPAASATIDLIDLRPNDGVVPIGRTPFSGPLAPGASVLVSMPPFVAAVVGEHALMIRVEDVMPDQANRDNDVLMVRMMIQPATGVPPPSPSAGGFRVTVLEDLRFVTVLGIIAVVLFAAIAILPRRRSESVELFPPPPDPPDQIPPPIWPP